LGAVQLLLSKRTEPSIFEWKADHGTEWFNTLIQRIPSVAQYTYRFSYFLKPWQKN